MLNIKVIWHSRSRCYMLVKSSCPCTSKSLHYKTKCNHLPWNSLDWEYFPSCSSSDYILQLCKVSSISQFIKRRCNNKTNMDRQGDSSTPPPPQIVFVWYKYLLSPFLSLFCNNKIPPVENFVCSFVSNSSVHVQWVF